MPRKILLIDDDRLQHRVVQAIVGQFRTETFTLDWADNYEAGFAKLMTGDYAVCLLDFQLGDRTGIELLSAAVEARCHTPIIFLTAESGGDVDLEALELGALDYLIKGEINIRSLERSVRYALKLGATLDALRLLATRDALTGLINRREIDRLLAEEYERYQRFRHPFSIAIFDIDRFKSINDTHGHPAGDAVLRQLAERLAPNVRQVDRLARFGGEEFAFLMIETDHAVALESANRLGELIRAKPFTLPDGKQIKVTMSGGVATIARHASRISTLIKAADQSLYRAKEQGRDRVLSTDATRET